MKIYKEVKMEEKFSILLKAARNEKGFTNKELAAFLEIKERTVHSWLWGESEPQKYAQIAILEKIKGRD